MHAGLQQGSTLSPALYTIYINGTPQTSGTYPGLFADDTCIYVRDCKEGYVSRKLQQGISATETWCDHLNIKVNEYET
jgi:hypothetical protein